MATLINVYIMLVTVIKVDIMSVTMIKVGRDECHREKSGHMVGHCEKMEITWVIIKKVDKMRVILTKLA